MIRVHVLRSLLLTYDRHDFELEAGPRNAAELLRQYRHPGWAEGHTVAAIVNGGKPITSGLEDLVLEEGDDLVLVPDPGAVGAVLAWIATNVILPLVVGAVATWAYSMIVGPPDAPSEPGGDDEASPTYKSFGARTSYASGRPIPKCYGIHRLVGQVISARIYERSGTEDVLALLLCLGQGPFDDVAGMSFAGQSEYDGLGGLDIPNPAALQPSGIQANGADVAIEDLRVFLRQGTEFQSPIPIWPILSTLYPASLPLNSGTNQTYTTDGEHVTQIKFRVRFDGLYEQTSAGLIPYIVRFGVSWRKSGTNQNYGPEQVHTIHRLSRGTQFWTIDQPLGPGSKYDVRLRRLTPDDKDKTYSKATWVGTIEEQWTVQPLRYQGLALASIEIRATERISGSSPTISLLCRCEQIDWWTSGGGWQGRTFYDSGTNRWIGRNPAWVLADFLTDEVGGLGRYFSRDNLDLESFEQWGLYCDEMVDDGNGSTHPRFHFDGPFDRQMGAWDYVMRILRAGQAAPVQVGNKFRVKFEHPDSPSFPRPTRQLFTQANITDFRISWKDTRSRPNIIDVEILDEDLNYERNSIPVEDAGAFGLNEPWRLDAEKVRRQPMNLFGVTRPAQAQRHAHFIHATNRLWDHQVSFTAGVDSVAVETGDLIAVETDVARFHDEQSVARRTTSAGAAVNTVALDEEVTLEAAKTYELFIVETSGEYAKRTVTSGAGTYAAGAAIAFSGAACTYPKGTVVALGVVAKTVGTYVVTACDLEEKDLTRRITALYYDPDAFVLPASYVGPGESYASRDLAALPEASSSDPAIAVADTGGALVLSWPIERGRIGQSARVYGRPVRVRGGDIRELVPDSWERLWQGAGSQARLEMLAAGIEYELAVVFSDGHGNYGSPEGGTILQVVPEEFPGISPLPAPWRYLVAREQGCELAWRDVRQEGLAEYEVRRGPTWNGAARVAVVDRPGVWLERAPYGAGQQYQVRPRSRAGLYSGPELIETVDVAPPEGYAIADEYDEATADITADWTLTGLVTDATHLLTIDDAELYGEATSRILDELTNARRWWSVLVDSYEEDIETTVGEAVYTAGSGEARWRTAYGREASGLAPGGDMELLVSEATHKVDHPAYLVSGREGGIGAHTGATVWTRFDEGAGFGDWIEGAWVGWREAQRMQIKVRLDRSKRQYQRRVSRVLLAVAE